MVQPFSQDAQKTPDDIAPKTVQSAATGGHAANNPGDGVAPAAPGPRFPRRVLPAAMMDPGQSQRFPTQKKMLGEGEAAAKTSKPWGRKSQSDPLPPRLSEPLLI